MPGTKRKAPANGEREVPSSKRSRHSPLENGENGENAGRQCSGKGMSSYSSPSRAANEGEKHQYAGVKKPDAKAKKPMLDSRPATKIEDEEESEDSDSTDGDSSFDEEEDEEREDGDGEPHHYLHDTHPGGVKEVIHPANTLGEGLKDNQRCQHSDDSEEDESEEESEEESVSSASDDYEYDFSGLRAHRERQRQRSYDRFAAKSFAYIEEVQKGADGVAAELSPSQGTRPIAAAPDDTGTDGQWRLYNQAYLAHEVHDHRLHLRKSTPEKPAYGLIDDQETQGIELELIIESSFPRVDFGANVLLPIDASLPDFASPEKFRVSGKDLDDGQMMLHAEHNFPRDQFFMDMVFLGNGYLKLCLPTFLFETSSMRDRPGRFLVSGDDVSVIEFVGKKDPPRHLRQRPKTPPSPRESYGGWLAGYNS